MKYLLIALIAIGCASAPQGVKEFKHIGLAGSQNEADFNQLKKAGYTRIVNLREAGEEGYSHLDAENERARAKAAGLEYIEIPLKRSDVKNKKLTHKKMQAIEAKIHPDGKKEKTLVHCSSAARASIWFGWHMNKVHGTDKETAMEYARKLGPGDEGALNALSDLLNKK